MKILKIVLVVFLVIIALAAVGGFIFVRYTASKALPDYSKNFTLPGNTAMVKVYRDSTAMPHIVAENEMDLYRTAGYLMAQDRIWQMDLLRRLTQGRLSEIFGKRMVGADQLFRSLHFSSKSEIVLDSCSSGILSSLEAFSEGVNQYLTDNKGKLPLEFSILGYEPEQWKPSHSVNLIGYMAWGLTMAWSMEINLYKIGQSVDSAHYAELIPDMILQDKVIYPDFSEKHSEELMSVLTNINAVISDLGLEVFQGSNNWAVTGSRSENGHAMMANDMHLELNAPGIWYQLQETVPGKLNVSGVVLPGQPFIICGHNEDVAWGMTNLMLDDMDFYLETIHPHDSLKYLYNGEWQTMRVERELIITKEGDTVVRNNMFTHRGPVISRFRGIPEKAISMRWIGNEYSNEITAVFKFNRMKNWDDFRDAARSFISISQNIVYADNLGNIGMQTAAGIPLREGEGIFIVPGDTSLYDWKGILPFENLPYSFNPESGYVASANNRTVGPGYPWYISRWFDLPNRYERIEKGLNSKEKLSVTDFRAMQADQVSAWAGKLVPYFTSKLKERTKEMSAMEKTAYELLESWDYSMSPESVPATIFEQFYVEFLKSMFHDELGDDLYTVLIDQDLLPAYLLDRIRQSDSSVWFDNAGTEKIETSSDLALEALGNTVDALRERLGESVDEWEWGKVHTLTLKHPLGSVALLDKAFHLNYGPYPVGGSYHTVSPYSYPLTDLFHANHGSSHRHIYVCGDWEQSLTILPTGISGIPASPYYCSMTKDYINYRYKPDYFSLDSVIKNSKYSIEVMVGNEGNAPKRKGGILSVRKPVPKSGPEDYYYSE